MGGKKEEAMLSPSLVKRGEKNPIWSLSLANAMFHDLLARLGPKCTKQGTYYRNTIEPGLKIAMTMRHLVSGDKYQITTSISVLIFMIGLCIIINIYVI